MAIVYKQYYTIYDLWLKNNLSFAPAVYKFFYPEEFQRREDLKNAPFVKDWMVSNDIKILDQPLLGSLQPFVDMAKDAVDTFKPYKTMYHFKRDLLQPILGVGNIFKGLFNIFCGPAFFLVRALPALGSSFEGSRYGAFSFYSKVALSWFIEGFASIARGATQIATSPLTLTFRLMTRGIITKIKQMPIIEQSESIQSLVLTGEKCLASGSFATVDRIRFELHRKYLKAVRRGQLTFLNEGKEQQVFDSICFKTKVNDRIDFHKRSDRIAAATQYFGLFSVDHEKQLAFLTMKSITTCAQPDFAEPSHSNSSSTGTGVDSSRTKALSLSRSR
jgi:hypothetical protein